MIIYRVPTKPGKPGILSFSFSCLENAWKSGKNLGKKLEICKFYVWSFTFQDFIYKNSSDLLLCHIYIINTNTDSKPNWPWISLLLLGNNVEKNMEFCVTRNPTSVLTHFVIFITKFCMKVPGIWHKQTLKKPGI